MQRLGASRRATSTDQGTRVFAPTASHGAIVHGEIRFGDGTAVYAGPLSDGVPTSGDDEHAATMRYGDGAVYTGTFKQGLYSGLGTLTARTRIESGLFEMGALTGRGTMARVMCLVASLPYFGPYFETPRCVLVVELVHGTFARGHAHGHASRYTSVHLAGAPLDIGDGAGAGGGADSDGADAFRADELEARFRIDAASAPTTALVFEASAVAADSWLAMARHELDAAVARAKDVASADAKARTTVAAALLQKPLAYSASNNDNDDAADLGQPPVNSIVYDELGDEEYGVGAAAGANFTHRGGGTTTTTTRRLTADQRTTLAAQAAGVREWLARLASTRALGLQVAHASEYGTWACSEPPTSEAHIMGAARPELDSSSASAPTPLLFPPDSAGTGANVGSRLGTGPGTSVGALEDSLRAPPHCAYTTRRMLVGARGESLGVVESAYTGQMRRGVPHGAGVLVATARDPVSGRVLVHDVYEGALAGGEPHGRGSLRALDGSSYEGEFECGVRHGAGRRVRANGTVVVGERVRGHKEGAYEYVWPNGDRTRCAYRSGVYVPFSLSTDARNARSRLYYAAPRSVSRLMPGSSAAPSSSSTTSSSSERMASSSLMWPSAERVAAAASASFTAVGATRAGAWARGASAWATRALSRMPITSCMPQRRHGDEAGGGGGGASACGSAGDSDADTTHAQLVATVPAPERAAPGGGGGVNKS